MMRSKEQFATILNDHVRLADKRLLEIGCGAGHYTRQLAPLCSAIIATDPDSAAIDRARATLAMPNVTYRAMAAEDLAGLKDDAFQVVVFTLSLHHVPHASMRRAIDEALHVVDPDGSIVFLEPDREGSLFEAELEFLAGDGDEREAKVWAYRAMHDHPRLVNVAEVSDRTEFSWDSLEDFMSTMRPRTNLSRLEPFLREHRYVLTAMRRINIFKVGP